MGTNDGIQPPASNAPSLIRCLGDSCLTSAFGKPTVTRERLE